MTHVSRKKVLLSTNKFLHKLVEASFSNLKGSELLGVLDTILSETELTMIKKRLGIILFLRKNIPTEIIEDTFKVTRQTVSRIALLLKTLPQNKLEILDRRLKKVFMVEGVKSFLSDINLSSRSSFKKKMSNLGYNF